MENAVYSISSLRLSTGSGLASAAQNHEMEKIMECPVCQEIPLPPIYTCETGHVICNECRIRLKCCALCRSPYTPSRNFTLESMVQAASFYCNYHQKGCMVSATLEELKGHHGTCAFAVPLPCYKNGSQDCNGAQLYLNEYVNHLKEVHQLRTLNSVKGHPNSFTESYAVQDWSEVSLKTNKAWKDCLLHYDGKVFTTGVFSRGPLFYFRSMLIGEQSDAKKYSLQLSISKSGNFQSPKCVLTTVITPLQEVAESHDKKLPAAVFHKDLLQHLGKLTPAGSGNALGDDPSSSPNNHDRLSWCVKYEIIKLENL